MSADFLFAACPAPLARITYATGTNAATAVTYLDIAPEEIWREPFRNWLMQQDTINRILGEIDPFAAHVDNWAELIESRVDGETIANDAGFRAWLDAFVSDPVIRDANINAYTQRAMREIADTFLEAAYSAFVTYVSQGAIYKREYITAGMSWGDSPTDNFDDVALLSWLDFFEDFPIADIDSDGNIVAWHDYDGNEVAAPTTN